MHYIERLIEKWSRVKGMRTYPLEYLELLVGELSEAEGHKGGSQLVPVEGALAARVEYLVCLCHGVEVGDLVLE